MSDDSTAYHPMNSIRRAMPVWLAASILAALLGGLATYQVMRAVGYDVPDRSDHGETGAVFAEMRARMEEMLRQSMMSMRGGRNPSEQQNLAALVGKLDLLSNGLCIELKPEQAEKLASTLAELDQAEQMTSNEAQAHLDVIQKLLTEEQNAALTAIELPRGGPSDNRGMRGTGDAPPGPGAIFPNGGGPPPGMMGGGMMGRGGPPSGDNPFQQEINRTRLHNLLDRLRSS